MNTKQTSVNAGISNEKGVAVLLLIATLLSFIKPYETTKKIDKLRTQIRKRFNDMVKHRPEFAKEAIKESDLVWEKAKKEIDNHNYTIGLEPSILALYSLIEDTKYGKQWFTVKTFYDAMRSMEAVTDERVDDAHVEQASNHLVDIFADALCIHKDTRLNLLRKKVYNNLVIEGKIK